MPFMKTTTRVTNTITKPTTVVAEIDRRRSENHQEKGKGAISRAKVKEAIPREKEVMAHTSTTWNMRS